MAVQSTQSRPRPTTQRTICAQYPAALSGGNVPRPLWLLLLVVLALLSAAPASWAAPVGDNVAIETADSFFELQTITAPLGTTVVWPDVGRAPHTVTADDNSFDSGILSAGQSFSSTFGTPGIY